MSGGSAGGPRLLVRDLAQLVTAPATARAPLRGPALRELEVVENAFVLCEGGTVAAVGPMKELAAHGLDGDVEELDGSRLCAIPGLVDCHTHPAFLGDRARLGLAFNEMVARGELSAPIVIGRDHLDSGSVASPYRETESMRDGSDAIADWPILNALLNVAAGATWVSVHHGGGVGIGNSIHAGMVVVADGSDEMAERLERVLTADPGTGVLRHADAGYDEALAAAKEHGLRVPLPPSRS